LKRSLARTATLHHLIGEHLGLNPTDHKCLDVAVRVGTRMTASLPAEETGLPTGPITGVVAAWERLAASVVKVIKMIDGYSIHRCLV
jgi:hypothetical protein